MIKITCQKHHSIPTILIVIFVGTIPSVLYFSFYKIPLTYIHVYRAHLPGHISTSPLKLDTLSREPSMTEGAASNILPEQSNGERLIMKCKY